MQRLFRSMTLIGMGIVLFSLAGVGMAAPEKSARLSLQDAEALVNQELFHNELKEVILHEITTDDAWKRLGVQVYQEGFLIDHRNIVAIFDPNCRSIQLYTSDLDRDGAPELICYFLSGSFKTTNFISVYNKGKVLKLGATLTDFVFHKTFSLRKESDQKISITYATLDQGNIREVSQLLYLRKEGSDIVVDVKE